MELSIKGKVAVNPPAEEFGRQIIEISLDVVLPRSMDCFLELLARIGELFEQKLERQ
jgi:hypothetical protein